MEIGLWLDRELEKKAKNMTVTKWKINVIWNHLTKKKEKKKAHAHPNHKKFGRVGMRKQLNGLPSKRLQVWIPRKPNIPDPGVCFRAPKLAEVHASWPRHPAELLYWSRRKRTREVLTHVPLVGLSCWSDPSVSLPNWISWPVWVLLSV